MELEQLEKKASALIQTELEFWEQPHSFEAVKKRVE